jgi:hypothetical protein
MTKLPRILLLLGLVALLFTFASGCSDDDDPTAVEQPQTAPTFSLGTEEQVQLPVGLTASDDPMAMMVVGQMALANSLTNYGALFVPPGKAALAAAGAPWVYTWSFTQLPDLDMTITLTVDETADSYTWVYVIDGFDEDGIYDNVVFYEAEVAKNGSWGTMSINEWESSVATPAFTWSWSTSVLGVFSMEMRTYGLDAIRLLWEIFPDGSGTLDLYEWFEAAWRPGYHFEWNALGAGSWILYNYDGGSNTTGSWSAGVPMKN